MKTYKIVFSIFIVFFVFIKNTQGAQTIPYCASPPFSTQSVKPNVLIVMDYSGSMQFPTYVPCNFSDNPNNKIAQCGDSSANYDSSQTYYGYFDPDKCYEHSNVFQESSCTCSKSSMSTSCLSGNLLNWISTTRIDVARKVLTGGLSNTGGNPTLDSQGAEYTITDDNLKCKFTISANSNNRSLKIENKSDKENCSLGTLNSANLSIKPSNPGSIQGVLQNFCDTSDLNGQINDKCKMIFEFMIFNSDNKNKGVIRVGKTATLSELFSAINTELPYNNGAPTGEALWEAYDYYKQSNDHNYASNNAYIGLGNAEKDPYYDGSGGNAKPAWCRKSFVLLISDGAWNGSVDPVNPVYTMHTTDLRSDLQSTQSVDTYTIYAFGDTDPTTKLQGRQAMITTAIFGGFNDQDGNNYPYPFNGLPKDSRLVTYPLSQCNPNGTYDSNCAEWDTLFGSPKDGLPYNFYEASDVDSLREALTSALNDILRRASAGASAAITNSSNQGAITLQSVFYPEKAFDNGVKIDWVGKLFGWWLYKPIGSDVALKADATVGSQPNLQLDLADPTFQKADPTNILDIYTPIFEAGYKLFISPGNSRTIYTNTDSGLTLFKVDNKSYISKYLGNLSSLSYLGSSDQDSNLIKYIRGEIDGGSPSTDNPLYGIARNRTATYTAPGYASQTGIWKLGDIIYSSPAVMQAVDYKDPSNTYNVIFVGANDGMLHAFKMGQPINTYKSDPIVKICNDNKYSIDALGNITCSDGNDKIGTEIWAFIPKNSLPYLRYLADPAYSTCHVYFNDLEPFVFNAYLSSGVKKILIGGMRFGGACGCTANKNCITPPSDAANGAGLSSYYALDVTDPQTPKLLWEFSDKNLGFSFSGPAIIKEYNGKQNTYFVMFLSGPTNYDGTSSQSLKAYILNLEDGSQVQTYDKFGGATYNNAFGGRLFTGGIIDNANSLTKAIPFGIQYQKPNGDWGGDVFLLLPSSWNIIKLDFGSNTSLGPITAKVATSKCQNTRQYIYFGTGRYFKPQETYNTNQNDYLYGVDITGCLDSSSTTCSIKLNNIQPQSQLNASYVPGFSWAKELITITDANAAGLTGSYLKERLYSDPTVNQNSVAFATGLPIDDLCGYGGSTILWSLTCGTGAPNQGGEIYLLSTSSGGIYPATAGQNNTTGIIATAPGMPTQQLPPNPGGSNQGIIIQWLEK